MPFLILLLCCCLNLAVAAEPQKATVIVPVADVWSRPLAPGENPSDELRETQVLFGEKVIIHESSGMWALIEAVEQPEFTHHDRWEGYPGWVTTTSIAPKLPKNHAKLHNPGFLKKWIEPQMRSDVLEKAEKDIGTSYLWGGVSSKGIDCSGLVHLAYRVNGMQIPRDSHDQWIKAKPIKRAELTPADLIFSAKADNPKKITHVALYAGDELIIEAPQTGMVVRKVSFKEKYGKVLSKVESGDKVGDRVIYFGSYLQK